MALLPGSPAIGAGGAIDAVEEIQINPPSGNNATSAFVGMTFVNSSTILEPADDLANSDFSSVIQSNLDALSSIGGAGGSVAVTSPESGVYLITFEGTLAGSVQPLISLSFSGGASGSISSLVPGFPGGSTDQTGYARSTTAPSIGAYENEGFTLTPDSSAATQSATVSTQFADPLKVTVASNNALLTDLAGGVISYSAPTDTTQPTASLSSATATIQSDNTASVTATADTIVGGPYTVSASASGVATAATFSLTNNNPGSLIVNTTGDPASPINGKNSLREAIAYAESLGGSQTVTFASSLTSSSAATITLTQTGDDTAGPSALGIDTNITIQGPTTGNGITIAGNDTQRLFYVAAGASLSLDDLTITDGSATGGSSQDGGGGAGLGGAIFSQGSVNILQSTLVGNTATGGNGGDDVNAEGGGGMGGNGNEENGGGPNGGFETGHGGFGGGGGDQGGNGGFGGGGGEYSGNGGFGGGGGGYYTGAGGFGGGGANGSYLGGAGAGMGGAIFNAAGSLSIIDSTLSANQAVGGNEIQGNNPRAGDGFGGAVFNLNGSLTLADDTFDANAVTAGTNQQNSSNNGTATAADVYTLGLANVVAYDGGPNIGPANGTASASLTDNLFVNGKVNGSAGTDLVLNNNSGNSTATGSNNLDTGSSGLTSGISTTVASTALDLGTLGNYGGTTQTIPLLAGSPAIGAGVAVDYPGTSTPITTDQRGYGPRPASPDIGAFQTFTPSISTSPQPASATVGTSIADKATVSGGYNPGGTVQFMLYSSATTQNSSTLLYSDSETLVNGSATSKGYTAISPGTDYWVASYGGDSNNFSVTSPMVSEPVTLTTSQAVEDDNSISVSENVIASSTTVTVTNSTTASGNVLVNDTGLAGDPSTITSITDAQSPGGVVPVNGVITIDGRYGTLVVQTTGPSAGNYTYTLDNAVVPPMHGGTDTFAYTLTDDYGNSSTANVVVTLNVTQTQIPISQAVEDDNSISVSENVIASSTTVTNSTTASGNVLVNDTGLAGDPSTITKITDAKSPSGVAAVNGVITIDGAFGTLVVQTTGPTAGNYTYSLDNAVVPPVNATDTFTYTLTDGYGNSSTANVVVTLNVTQTQIPVSQAVEDDNSISVSESFSGNTTTVTGSTTATGNVLANDKNLSADPSTITKITDAKSPSGVTPDANGVITIDGTYGTLVLQTAGTHAGNYSYSLDSGAVPPAGSSDTFTYTLTDGSGNASTATLTVDMNVSVTAAPTGSLSGSSASASTTDYNLTSLGTSDWAHWGTDINATAFDHKASGGSQISNVTHLGSGSYGAYSDPSRTVSWTDGTPLAADTGDQSYIWANSAVGAGYQFTVPAGTTTQTLYIDLGGYDSGGTLTAHLSDSSAQDYSVSFSGTAHYTEIVAISFKAGSAGQTLTLRYVKSANIGPLSGSVDLVAAWLDGAAVAPQVTLNPKNTSVTAGSSVTLTAAASGTPTPAVQWQSNTGAGTSFTNITGATSTSYTFTAATGENGDQYRAVFTNPANSVTTSAATLTVTRAAAPSGSLAGSSSTAATTTYNLTALGTVDWAHWGTASNASAFDHKATGGSEISNVTKLGSANYGAYSIASRNVSWTDGTPLASDTGDQSYIWANDALGAGYSFTVAASTTKRTLYIDLGGYSSGGTLTAHLSDSSATDYSVSFSGTSHYTEIVAITFNAASAGQKLTLSYVKSQTVGYAGGSIDLIAAWLA
jgi:hypothetical protein